MASLGHNELTPTQLLMQLIQLPLDAAIIIPYMTVCTYIFENSNFCLPQQKKLSTSILQVFLYLLSIWTKEEVEENVYICEFSCWNSSGSMMLIQGSPLLGKQLCPSDKVFCGGFVRSRICLSEFFVNSCKLKMYIIINRVLGMINKNLQTTNVSMCFYWVKLNRITMTAQWQIGPGINYTTLKN